MPVLRMSSNSTTHVSHSRLRITGEARDKYVDGLVAGQHHGRCATASAPRRVVQIEGYRDIATEMTAVAIAEVTANQRWRYREPAKRPSMTLNFGARPRGLHNFDK